MKNPASPKVPIMRESDCKNHEDSLSESTDSSDPLKAQLVLNATRAQRDVRLAEKTLADCILKENAAPGKLYKFEATEAERKLEDTNIDIGFVRHSVRKSGITLYEDSTKPRKHRRESASQLGAETSLAASDVWDAYMEKKVNQTSCQVTVGARGCAAYHPSRATAPATTDGSSDHNSAAPMVPNIGAGLSEDTHMADAHVEQELSWRHVLHDGCRPIFGSSDLAPISPSTQTSRIGKHAHSDITSMNSQSIIAPSSTFTSISQ
ncbi:hypothetical protein C8R48DRAFT_777418 [Suillus tomentosus]|nr:hypothetical protein C8R48DRAFT_777418 [Suillus tomentosus]